MLVKKVIHLMNRAAFGLSFQEANQVESLQKLIHQLVWESKPTLLNTELPSVDTLQKKPASKKKRAEMRKDMIRRVMEVNQLWFDQMISTDQPLIEKMTLFWVNHFVVDHKTPLSALPYNNLLRSHALGNFRDLTNAVAKSASMINYLHLRQNNKDAPNEDFARELCELFTLGRDNVYSEFDIKEIARSFTGWKIDLNLDYRFAERQHDFGSKTIFGKTGNFNGEDVINLILDQPATARFLSKKLYRSFVNENPNQRHIQELADVLFSNNYEIKPWLEHLFTADWFYDLANTQSKIKSPTELMVMMARQLGFRYNNPKNLLALQKLMGEVLFSPPNVAGWPGGRDWIDSTRLILRMQLGNAILQGAEIIAYEKDSLDTMPDKTSTPRKLKLEIEAVNLNLFQDHHTTREEEQLALLGTSLPGNDRNFQLSQNLVERLAQYTSLPEYQLC